MKPKLPNADCSSCTLRSEPLVPPFGDGRGYIAIVGEAPGADEVKKGRPFIGRSGSLLRELMVKAHIEVDRVYYTNSVMCRPPKNRDPEPEEILCCYERLLKELARVKPDVIMPLGGFAHQAVMRRSGRIKKARGKPEEINIAGHKTVAISSIHPAAILRSPDDVVDLYSDLMTALSICKGEPAVIWPPIDRYILIQRDDRKRMEALLRRLEGLTAEPDGRILAVDLETDGLQYMGKDIVSCALSWARETAVAFDWDIIRDSEEYRERLGEALSILPCSFHNGLFDLPWFHQEGIYPNYQYDTMLASYCLDERKGIHDLERLTVSHYRSPAYKLGEAIKNVKAIDKPELLEYNATDVDYTRRLSDDLRVEMDEDDRGVMDGLLMPAARHFTAQFEDGMLVDLDHLEDNGRRWREEIESIEEELRRFPGAADVNPNSPKQVAHYMYDVLGLRKMRTIEGSTTIDQAILLEEIQDIEDPEAQEYWHTQSVHTFGKMSTRTTNTYMLFWLAQQHDYPRVMIKHRLLSKKYGTYYKGIKDVMWPDGRIRPSWHLHGTVTGRQSSSDPNLHGTPRDPMIKDSYIADDGFLILYGDFPQAEVRMLAHLSDDADLTAACGQDIHTAIAKRLFRLSDEQWAALPKLEREIKRRAAKTIVFGIIYGRGAKGLAPQLAVSKDEAQGMIDEMLNSMPSAKKWIERMKMQAILDHQVQSIYGRKRRFYMIADRKQKAEVQRQAANMPIQSGVSDMTFRAYYNTCKELGEAGIEYKRWAQIHDAFMILVREGDVERAGAIMKDVMENRLDFETDVPFGPVEIKYGRSWGNLKDLG